MPDYPLWQVFTVRPTPRIPSILVAAALLAAGSVAAASPAAAATQSCTALNGKADASSSCTPGAFNPDVTPATINSTICVSGWTRTVRPPASYTNQLKDQQKPGYGEGGISDSNLEEDHLIPLELGGAPRDPHNLWPEPRDSVSGPGQGAENKDTEENNLKKQVCNGSLTLDQARHKMLQDWTH